MKTEMISAAAAVKEYLRISGHQGELDKNDVIAWANDAASRIITDEQFIHKISLIEIHDYKGRLPIDFKTVVQAAYNISPIDACERKKEIIAFSDRQMGCNVEVFLECPKCHEVSCECNSKDIIVNVDRLWRNSHPEHYVGYMKHFHDYMNAEGGKRTIYHPEFMLMRSSTASFGNINYHIKQCINLNIDCAIEYSIEHPNILVNFREGTVLLSYLAKPIDEDGYLMIPNEPVAIEAISWYIQEKMLYRKFMEDYSQNVRIAWQQAMEMREKLIGRAKSQLQIPDSDKWGAFIQNFIHRLLPNYKHESDLYRAPRSTYKYPEQTNNYK